jgi:hypothetical protein
VAVLSPIWAEAAPGVDLRLQPIFRRKISGKISRRTYLDRGVGAARRTTWPESGMNEPLQYQVRLKLNE